MVEYVSVNDFYEIKLASLYSNIDNDVLIELYQPIIGSLATILYLNLIKQKQNEDVDNVYSMENLLVSMQIAPGQLLSARHFLEGVGLLKTFEKDLGENRSYIFVLYSPKNPNEFFNDVLFKGLLIQAIGEKEALLLVDKYTIETHIDESYKDITTSFVDVFSIDYNDPSFSKEFNGTMLGHKSSGIKIGFDYDKFFAAIEENSQIKRSVFSKKDMKEIERIAALYGMEEPSIAFVVSDLYKPYENPHLDYYELSEKCRNNIKTPTFSTKKRRIIKSKLSSSNNMAKKIQFMENTSPADYLELLQNGSKPSGGDLKTIDFLSRKYNFSNGVINAIIDYTLEKCHNVLNKEFTDSVSASIAREGVYTVVDVMNYLCSNSSKNKSNKKIDKPNNNDETSINIETDKNHNNEVISDDELMNMLKTIENKKNGGN